MDFSYLTIQGGFLHIINSSFKQTSGTHSSTFFCLIFFFLHSSIGLLCFFLFRIPFLYALTCSVLKLTLNTLLEEAVNHSSCFSVLSRPERMVRCLCRFCSWPHRESRFHLFLCIGREGGCTWDSDLLQFENPVIASKIVWYWYRYVPWPFSFRLLPKALFRQPPTLLFAKQVPSPPKWVRVGIWRWFLQVIDILLGLLFCFFLFIFLHYCFVLIIRHQNAVIKPCCNGAGNGSCSFFGSHWHVCQLQGTKRPCYSEQPQGMPGCGDEVFISNKYTGVSIPSFFRETVEERQKLLMTLTPHSLSLAQPWRWRILLSEPNTATKVVVMALFPQPMLSMTSRATKVCLSILHILWGGGVAWFEHRVLSLLTKWDSATLNRLFCCFIVTWWLTLIPYPVAPCDTSLFDKFVIGAGVNGMNMGPLQLNYNCPMNEVSFLYR